MNGTSGIALVVFTLATVAWHFLFAFGWWQSIFLGCLTAAVLAGLLAIWIDVDDLSRHFGRKD
jgi:Co/Zn/Cd efflux system component